MEKKNLNSKKKIKPVFLAAIIVVGVVVASVIGAIFVLNIVNDGVDHYSGMFSMMFETHTNSIWTFSAQSAQAIAPFTAI